MAVVATDSYMLLTTESMTFDALTAWVPQLVDEDDELAPPPELDEAPLVTAVAIDPHGRAKGLLAHLLRLATKKDAPLVQVRLQLGVVSNADDHRPALDGMEAKWVVVEQAGHERLRLPVYDGEYPNWRALFVHHEPVKTEAIGLSTWLVGRLAKLGTWWPDAPLVWHFGGELGAAAVEVHGALPPVSGLVMPVRWNLEHNRPAAEVEAEEAAAAAAEGGDQ